MKLLVQGFLFLSSLILLAGCTEGSLIDFGPSKTHFSNVQITTQDYTATETLARVQATINDPSKVVPLHEITFFTNDTCQLPSIGNGLAQDLGSSGLSLHIPIGNDIKLYFTLNTGTDCFYLANYNVDIDLKPTVTFEKTIPASPSRTSYQPAVFGRIFPSSGSAELYSDAACTTLLVSAQHDEFLNTGKQITLVAETNNAVYAKAKDLLGQESACALLTNYIHTTAVAPVASFVSATPGSPQNQTTTPLIRGTVGTGIAKVNLYSDAACSTAIGTGSHTVFANPGIQATVHADATTNIYAQTEDTDGLRSNCILLTSYVHDAAPPMPPTFVSANPASPTRLTTFPKIKGSAPADAQLVRMYDSNTCQSNKVIGWSTRTQFINDGINANLTPNKTTAIYATSVDAAGNASTCTLLTNYRHNTIPPASPIFLDTDPMSPNNFSTTPKLLGMPADLTKILHFFSDENCAVSIGNGLAVNFETPGIQVTVPANTISSIYATAEDEEGNQSECAFLASYAHSNIPATNVAFSMAFPASPTRVTDKPYLIGTADATIVTVEIFSDALCTNLIGSGSRASFLSAGIVTTVPSNATTQLYAKSTNIYGNFSTCSPLTTYTHANLPPLAPVMSSITPTSPNRISSQPVLQGSSSQNPASPLAPNRVIFYDSAGCVSNIGEGTPGDFGGSGIQVTLPENAVSQIYARSFDAAFNGSACVHMTDYTHDNLKPSKPVHGTATPNTPSYTNKSLFKGTYAASPDFMNRVSIEFYSDNLCSSLLASGSPTQYTSSGIQLTVQLNATTPIYARTFNEVGSSSDCTFLVNYLHSDIGASSLAATATPDGLIRLNWMPDSVASPTPTYTVKRALESGGPYTVIASGVNSGTYVDARVNQGLTYYYRVQASNNTGLSKDTSEVSFTVNAPAPVQALSLTATPSSNEVSLSWTGFVQNSIYKVERSLQSGGPYTRLAAALTGTTFLDSTVTNGVVYYYRIVALNPSGESTASNEVQAVPIPPPAKIANIWISPRRSSAQCSGAPGVHIFWSPAEYTNGGYEIWRQTNGSTMIGTSSQTEFVDCNPSSSYVNRYSVVAKWGSYSSVNSDQVLFYNDGSFPLTVYPGDSHVLLGWNMIGAATSADIYRASDVDGPFTLLLAGSVATSYTDNAVTNGTGYQYLVQGRNGAAYVGWPSVTTGGTPAPVPNAPQNLIVSENSSNFPVLNWAVPTHYNRFIVSRASSPGGPYNFLSYSTVSEFVDSSPLSGMNYYRVTAQWGNAQTTYSNTASYRRAPLLSLTATRNAGDITLNWNLVSGISDYRVERATSKDGPFTSIGFPATNTFADSSAVAGTGYYYRVRARFADTTEGQFSTVVSAMLSGATTPSGLSAITVSASSVNVGWISVTGASTYNLYRATSLGGPYTLAGDVGSAVTNYNFTALTGQTQYYFKVGAMISATEHLSNPLAVVTLAKPLAPSGDVGVGQISLTWMPATGALSYNLERTSDSVNFTTIASGLGSTSFTDSGLTNGQNYFYRLIVNYSLGSATSDLSAQFTPGVAPIAPAGLYIKDNSTGTGITLAWAPSSNTSAYYVYMSTVSGGPYGAPQLSVGTHSGATVGGLNPNTIYYFVVTSRMGSAESAYSSQIAVRTQSTPPAPVVTYQSPSSIQITWSSVAAASTYNLERSSDNQNFFTIATGIAGTSYTDSSFTLGRNYSYRFRPIAAGGENLSLSGTSNMITTEIAPIAPVAVTANPQSLTSIKVSWARVPDAVNYRVYRSTTSGSGFVLVQTVADPTVTWTNTGLTTGVSYYFVIQSVNASGVPSVNSTEASVTLSASPTGLAAVNSGTKINLSWNSVGGATSYNLYRSDNSGGPYGFITNTAGLTYQDTQGIPGKTYYYIVNAQFASGLTSINSNEVNLTKSGGLKFQVPIEMIDRGISSRDLTSHIFTRSLTRIDTTDYDGTVSYNLELTATNSDSVSKTIELLDTNDSVLATISVPGSTIDITRFETSFSLSAGAHTLKLRLAATSLTEMLTVPAARILISQDGATKTRIYFPLLASSQGATSEDETALMAFSNNTSYDSLPEAMPYVRNALALSRISEYNAWRMDVITYADTGVEGVLKLENLNAGAAVGNLETEIRNNSPKLVQIPIQEGVAQFTTGNENHRYEPQLKCTSGCGLGAVHLLKAGLWVRLEDLTKLQVAYRTGGGADMIFSDTDLTNFRSKLDLSKFSSPQIFFQATATLSSGNADILLSSVNSNDSGLSGLHSIPSTQISYTSGLGKQTQRTGSPITLTTNDRLLTSLRTSGSSIYLHGTQLIINLAP